MKVIDLLNKIANGEEVPKKIQFAGYTYEQFKKNDNTYNYINSEGDYFEDEWYLMNILNKEVQIIEDTPKEEKKIENLKSEDFNGVIDNDTRNIIIKINEIIDKVNGEDNDNI